MTFEVTSKEFHQAISNDKQLWSQNVNVNVTASAQASFSISQQFSDIVSNIDQFGIKPELLNSAKDKVKTLEGELKKTNR